MKNDNNDDKIFYMNVKRGVMWSKRKIILDETMIKYYNPSKKRFKNLL
jgi:hypothetical protein